MKDNLVKQLNDLKENISKPNSSYMGMHPGTNYPYVI